MTRSDHFPGGGWTPPPAWRPLALDAPGWQVWEVDETGSTNTDLVEAAASGAPDRAVLVAAHQTAGRGRLDRRWDAPPGANLLVSILLRTVPDPPSDLTRRVGLAARAAVTELTGADARLKWPNDLLLDGRKLAGILAQRAPDGPVVVGLGMNIGWAPEGAARLADLGDRLSRHALLAGVLRAFDALPADIHDAYRGALDTLGRSVVVSAPSGDIEGRAIDIERDGRLVVVDACAITHRIDAGDVFLRPD